MRGGEMNVQTYTAPALRDVLRSWKLRRTDEKILQSDIETVFRNESIEYQREVKLGEAGIIDFVVGRVGIEVKIAGSYQSVARQVIRYAEHPDLDEILLVTTVANHRKMDSLTLQGKSVVVYWFSLF
jgi:hypothetical protein